METTNATEPREQEIARMLEKRTRQNANNTATAKRIAAALNTATKSDWFTVEPVKVASGDYYAQDYRTIRIAATHPSLKDWTKEATAESLSVSICRFPGNDRYSTAADKGKYAIAGSFTQAMHKIRSYKHKHHEIKASHEKPPEAIAGDILRRLLPDFIAEAVTVYASLRGHHAYNADKDTGLASLLPMLPETAKIVPEDRGAKPDRNTDYISLGSYRRKIEYSPNSYGDVTKPGTYSIEYRDLTRAQIEAIAAILKAGDGIPD